MESPTYEFKCGCQGTEFISYKQKRSCPEHKKTILRVWLNCDDCHTTLMRKPVQYRTGDTVRCPECRKKHEAFLNFNFQRKNRSGLPVLSKKEHKKHISEFFTTEEVEEMRAMDYIRTDIFWPMPDTPKLDSFLGAG